MSEDVPHLYPHEPHEKGEHSCVLVSAVFQIVRSE